MKCLFACCGLFIALAAASTHGQPNLLLAFDFEGEVGSTFAVDKSGFGTQLDALLFPGASIVNDPVRGDVLVAGSAGLGAATLHDEKIEVTESFTMSTWFKMDDPGRCNPASVCIFEHVVGRAGVGPRIMNHFGLGAVSFTQFIEPFDDPFLPFFGDEIVDFGPGDDPSDQWHHLLLTWNHVTREFWGYWDGETGPSGNNGNPTGRKTVVTHEGPPGLPFNIIGDPNTDKRIPNSRVDDVAFWEGYAPPEVAQGLFDGTYTIFDAPIVFPSAGSPVDTDDDGDVDGADFLNLQRDNPDLITPEWQAAFGVPAPSNVAVATVPEPAGLVWLAVTCSMLARPRRLA